MKFKKIISLNAFFLWGLAVCAQWNQIPLGGGYLNCGAEFHSQLVTGSDCGVFSSTDGSGFEPLSKGMKSGTMLNMVNLRDTLYCTILNKGFFMSIDGGVSWSHQNKNIFPYSLYPYISELNQKLMFSHAHDSFALSNDHGKTWLKKGVGFYTYTQPFGAGNMLYVSGNGSAGPGWYMSSNEGNTWSLATSLSNKYCNYVTKTNNTWYALGAKVLSSNDGVNWTQVADTVPHPYYPGYPFGGDYYAYDGTYFYTLNGGNIQVSFARWKSGMPTWELISGSNLPSTGNFAGIMATKNALVVSRIEHTYYSNDAGKTFKKADMKWVTTEPVITMNTFEDNLLLSWKSRLYGMKDIDYGVVDKPFTGFSFATDRILAIYQSKQSTLLGIYNTIGVCQVGYASQGNTKYFAQAYSDNLINKFSVVNGKIHNIGYDPVAQTAFDGELNDSGRVIATRGSNDFQYYHQMLDLVSSPQGKFALTARSENNKITSFVYKYSDLYNTWNLPPSPYRNNVFSAKCLESWNGKLYLGTTQSGVLENSDTIKTWQNFNFGIEKMSVNDLTAHGDTLLAATDSGIYFITKGQTQWKNISGNLISGSVKQVECSNNHIFARLENGGIWRLPLNGFVSGTEAQTTEIVGFSIFPNPTNSQITIQKSNNQVGHYFANIYNLQGQMIWQKKCSSDQTVDLTLCPVGIYYLTIKTDEGSFSYKIIKQQ